MTHSSSHIVGPRATYYDRVEPDGGATKPSIVMIHGGAHTGACYLTTADGRPGWAYDFARAGHRVLVPDWPGVGRSGYVPANEHTGEVVCAGLADVVRAQDEPVILLTHSMGGQFGWKLLEMLPERVRMIVGVAPGPPGNMQPEPIVLHESADEVEMQRAAGTTVTVVHRRRPFVPTTDFLEFKLIGPGTRFPRECTDAYRASLLPVPAQLLIQRMNYRGAALKLNRPAAVAGKRIMLVHGTDDPDHPHDFERQMGEWLAANGANVEHFDLGEHGIAGNGHMLMLERNSAEIAAFIAQRLPHD